MISSPQSIDSTTVSTLVSDHFHPADSKISEFAIAYPHLMPLLVQYHLIPNLIYESIIDRAIEPFSCTVAETTAAVQQFYALRELTSADSQQAWRSHYGLSAAAIAQMATRPLRIEKFKQATWGHKLESYFLQRKPDLDRAIYSLLRTKQQDIAHELYFRLSEQEQSFAEAVQLYSEGVETETGGLLGPVELGRLHPKLAKLLSVSAIGSVEPLAVGDWYLLVRLEKIIPARFEQEMQQRLLQEQFEAWLETQLQQLPQPDRVWLGQIA